MGADEVQNKTNARRSGIAEMNSDYRRAQGTRERLNRESKATPMEKNL